MIVYHGTDSASAENIIQNGIEVTYGNHLVDNGPGFYMTPQKEFAAARAQQRTQLVIKEAKKTGLLMQNVIPVLIELNIDISQKNDLRICKFRGCPYAWKQFVLLNRISDETFSRLPTIENHNRDAKFDIVVDETADANLADIITDVNAMADFSGLDSFIKKVDKSRKAAWGTQISIHTTKAVKSCVKSMNVVPCQI